jgi:transaldolase
MSLSSLITTGTKVWLDGIDPDELAMSRAWGITGATSNPIIISRIAGRGGLDGRITELIARGLSDAHIAWALDDELVTAALRLISCKRPSAAA